MIPEIDIWRAANLMLKRYGEKALEESATRACELAATGDDKWRRHLAPDLDRGRAARQQHTAWAGTLIRTSPQRPGSSPLSIAGVFLSLLDVVVIIDELACPR